MKPSRIEYDLGKNRHGQPLRLVQCQSNGGEEWILYRDAANQRDDAAFISGLTLENLRDIAEIANARKP